MGSIAMVILVVSVYVSNYNNAYGGDTTFGESTYTSN